MTNNTGHTSKDDGGRGGIKFGTDVAYDESYLGFDGGAGGDDDGMVKTLPTLEEERRLMGLGDDDIDEDADEGRVDGYTGGSGRYAGSRASRQVSWNSRIG